MKFWSQYLQYLLSYLDNFLCHLANAVPLLETNLLASFDVALTSERKKPSWINWMIEISLSTRSVMLCRFPAHRSRFWVSHHTTYWEQLSLTLYRPAVHTCSHFSASIHRHMLRETARASCSSKSLSILIVLEPFGLSSHSRLLLLASHRMVLTTECKNLSRITQEIKISQFLLCWSPTFVLKHNSRPQVFSSTICWSWWSINNCEAFD